MDIVPANISLLHVSEVKNRKFMIADAVKNVQSEQSAGPAKNSTSVCCNEWHVPHFLVCSDHVYV